MPENTPTIRYVDYVVVVHGIGEQRPNETILPVINRLAEARIVDAGKEPPGSNVLSMGKIAAQVGTRPKSEDGYKFTGMHPWAQFEGIPTTKTSADALQEFDGTASAGETDIRFVDFCWSDILNDYYEISGQGVGPWTESVIDRLYSRKANGKQTVDNWVLKALEQVQETALFAQTIAGLPGINQSEAVNEVLDQFVGDIQIYGENESVRGRAVLRFHNLMEKLHNHHLERYHLGQFRGEDVDLEDTQENLFMQDAQTCYVPRYTIVAHSLGTVVSMDALLYAHVRKDLAYNIDPNRDEQADAHDAPTNTYRNIPFHGYPKKALFWYEDANRQPLVGKLRELRSDSPYIGGNWVFNVHSFVTLGSPIDKYLVLWNENYQYLDSLKYSGAPADPTELFAARGDNKIYHFNYCDEQDPVGHHLNTFSQYNVYNELFTNLNGAADITYSHYVWPGVAHVMYWDDLKLFRLILHQTVDRVTEGLQTDDELVKEIQAYHKARTSPLKYFWTLLGSYFAPGILAALACAALFVWGVGALTEVTDPITGQPTNSPKTAWIAALALAGALFFFRKVIRLFVWWRQILLMKTKESTDKYRKLHRLTARFGLWLVFGVSFVLSTHYLAVTIGNMETEVAATWRNFLGMSAIGVVGVMLLNQVTWKSYSSIKFQWFRLPEFLSVVVLGLLVLLGSLLPGHVAIPAIAEKSWIPEVAVGMTALCITWVYLLTTFYKAKNQLK